jgi:TolA-binding protein
MKYTWIEILVGVAMFLGVVWWSVVNSDEPLRLIARWAITLLMLGGMLKFGVPMLFQGQVGAIVGMLIIGALGIVIGIVWASTWTAIAFSPLTSAFDGGSQEVEAKALYSAAETKRKRGQFEEAIADVHQQLERFPNDFHGLLLLAEIQSENLHDFSAAQATVNLICETHRNSPAQASGALMAMADRLMNKGQIEEARGNLQAIIDYFPNTSFSRVASQRLARLEQAAHTHEERGRVIVLQSNYAKDVGLNEDMTPVDAQENPAALASEYVAHLQLHPLDTMTRQKLAALYAECFQRIDLAQLEYEQLIAQPNQSAKQISQHLNLLADWQAKLGHGDAARKTLHRIIERFPRTALADAAQDRVARLGTEIRGQEKSQAIKLGSYKKDLGLNRDY